MKKFVTMLNNGRLVISVTHIKKRIAMSHGWLLVDINIGLCKTSSKSDSGMYRTTISRYLEVPRHLNGYNRFLHDIYASEIFCISLSSSSYLSTAESSSKSTLLEEKQNQIQSFKFCYC